MVAEYCEKIQGDVYDFLSDSGSHLEVAARQLQAVSSSRNGYTPKVRKEYTVKNDRQKWTDGEHLRFIEAIKLYKRNWSQIEAHVGTKSAIQIRSHAQKYFAKVERGSNSGFEGSLDPLEIPPPRPKKKPTHPYPKKNPMHPDSRKAKENGKINANQDEGSPSPIIVERDTSSLISVLSAMGSDTSVNPSPKSCITDVEHSVNPLLMENDNEYMTSNPFDGKEKGHHLEIIQVTTPATNSPEPNMLSLRLGGKFSLDNAATDESSTTIKLFGKTITSQKPSSSATGDSAINLKKDATVDELNVRNVQLAQYLPNVDPKRVSGFINGSLSQFAWPAPDYSMSGEYSDAGVVSGGVPVCGWFRGMYYPVDTVVVSVSPCVNIEVNELKTKTSSIESEAGSRILQQESATEKGVVAASKRCVTERDETSSLGFMEERKRQRAQVCC